MKPRLWKSMASGWWVCGMCRWPISTEIWGVGETPEEAFTRWKEANNVT